MQNVSQKFLNIYNSGDYESEVKVKIQNIYGYYSEFNESQLLNVSISRTMLSGSNFTIGSACVASCELTIISDDVPAKQISNALPRGARIEIYERIAGETYSERKTAVVGNAIAGVAVVGQIREYAKDESEWLLQGVFFIDTRDSTSWAGQLTISGIDCMAMGDAYYPPTNDGWPENGVLDKTVVSTIAGSMGTRVEPSTLASMDKGYRIPFPGTYTMREILSYIGVMYCGNWIINKEGNLQLIKQTDFPAETYFLINRDSDILGIRLNGANVNIIIRGGVWLG